MLSNRELSQRRREERNEGGIGFMAHSRALSMGSWWRHSMGWGCGRRWGFLWARGAGPKGQQCWIHVCRAMPSAMYRERHIHPIFPPSKRSIHSMTVFFWSWLLFSFLSNSQALISSIITVRIHIFTVHCCKNESISLKQTQGQTLCVCCSRWLPPTSLLHFSGKCFLQTGG